ncbi:MAG: TonB-dependent siderophore receptor [Gammaproteobacteria bacterium]
MTPPPSRPRNSARFGLLYHPLPWLALYGSYAEGFGGVNEGVSADGSPLGSQLSQQYEVGVKAELLDGRLTGSLAFFDLTRENIATPVPGMPNVFEVAGEAQNRGIEFDVSGALTEHWRLIASYSYIDSEITKDRDAEGGTGNQGNRVGNAPRDAGSLWTQYELTQFGWPGLTAGIGAFFVGQREGDNNNSFQLPGYGRMDTALGYSWRIGPSKLTAQFNVENLLDKEYFLTSQNRLSIQPGAPRTFVGAIRVEF